MHKITSLIVMLFITANGFCQTVKIRYFKDSYLQKETTQDKAKFTETTIKNADGSVTTEVKGIRQKEVVSSETYKGEEPAGIWKYNYSNIPEPLDFSFNLVYNGNPCIDTVAGLKDYFENNAGLNYVAPKVAAPYGSMPGFLSKNLRYPDGAREKSIEGKVYLAFKITSAGNIEDIVVKKSAHVLLDKEAVRVIRKLKLSSPPMVNGQPKEVCVTMPIGFKLE